MPACGAGVAAAAKGTWRPGTRKRSIADTQPAQVVAIRIFMVRLNGRDGVRRRGQDTPNASKCNKVGGGGPMTKEKRK